MFKPIFVLLFYTLLKMSTSRLLSVPVLIIDNNNIMHNTAVPPNPFVQINSTLFSKIALSALRKSECVILFIEEQLSVEDLRTKDELGTPYRYLRQGINGTEVTFMPSVSEPYEVLTKVFEPHMSNIFHLGPGEMPHVLEQHKFVYVFFKRSREPSRVEKLRRHDVLMKEVYYNLRLMKRGPVVAFYTGKVNPIVPDILRQSSSSDDAPKKQASLVSTPQAVYRFTLYFMKDQTESVITAEPDIKEEIRTQAYISTTMLFPDFAMKFQFYLSESNWKLEGITLMEGGTIVAHTGTSIVAPWYRSYYCNELCDMPIIIYNQRNRSTFIMYDYQFEPKRHPEIGLVASTKIITDWDTKLSDKFNHSVQCCPYFNKAILSGLIVTFLFFGILFLGILMLFNCKVGDQYEDPTQEHIVIASEAGPIGWDKHK